VADIFREVDEELQQERAAKLWGKYGGWVIAVALAVVLGVAGNVFWTNYKADSRASQSAALETALLPLAEDRPAAAASALGQFAGDADVGYAMIARFQEAAAQVQADDIDGAVATYEAIASNADTPEPYGDLATVKLVRLQIGKSPAAELTALLAPALEDTSPWRPLARETEAMLAISSGDIDAARTILLELIQQTDIPNSLRTRATELVAALGG
jgi:hypothetical protein